MDIIKIVEDSDFNIEVNSSYINRYGNMVPRVTEILSQSINEEYIANWANSLGWKRQNYKKVLQELADIGTEAHNIIENYLKDGVLSMNIPFLGFHEWWKQLNNKNTVEILGLEESLVCDHFGGTYDGLLKINDKIFLIDYKTSNNITYKHFIQLSAYRHMLYNDKNINIDGCIILQLNKKEVEYTEYVLEFNNINHYNFIEDCSRCFFSLLYSYYNFNHIKSEFKNIF